jgi:hypothetical protein
MNTINMVDPYLYVEFYDVWSDYSVIMPIEDINPAGLNTLFIDTVNEPVEDEFTDKNRGGVDPDLLTTWEATSELSVKNIYQPILSKTTRIKQILRENNLYLVRMAAIDNNREDLGTVPTASMYTSTYKLLVINENYNSWYDKLNDIGKTTGVDFNSENYNTTYTFDFDTKLDGGTEDAKKEVDNQLTCKTTKNNTTYYYSYNQTNTKDYAAQSYKDKYTKTGRFVLNTDVKSATVPFGYLTNISTSVNGVDASKTYITDTDTDVTSEFKVERITGVANTEGIDIKLYTERSITANINEERKDNKVEKTRYKLNAQLAGDTPTQYARAYLWQNKAKSYKNIFDIGSFKYGYESLCEVYSQPTYLDTVNVTSTSQKKHTNPNGDDMRYILDYGLSKAGLEAGDAMSVDCTYYPEKCGSDQAKLEYESTSSTVWSGEPWALMLRTNTSACIVKFDNTSEVLNALDDIYAANIVDETYYLYTYDEVISSATSTTELVGFVNLTLSSLPKVSQRVDGTAYTTTDGILKALSDKITKLEGSKKDLSTKYLKIEASEIQTVVTVDIPEISITAAADKTMYNNLLKSSTDIKTQEPALFISSPYENMTPFSLSGEYANQAKRFTFKLSGSTPRFTYKPGTLAVTKWNINKGIDEEGPQVDKVLFDQL